MEINGSSSCHPTHSCTSFNQCAVVVWSVVAVASAILIALGALQFFGNAQSVGFVASIAEGSIGLLLAIGAITTVFCLSKKGERPTKSSATKRVEEESESEAVPPKLCIVTDSFYEKHLTGDDHPESPDRIRSINDALVKAGLKDEKNSVAPRHATLEELKLCHNEKYIALAKEEIGAIKEGQVAKLSTGDVMVSKWSFEAAQLSAGGVLTAVDHVLTGESDKAFCVVRPPGHHASDDRGAGFCVFNNVAIAARYAQQKYHLDRVLIVDWDVHHGDGTQAIFYEDPSVFYFSTHEAGNYPFKGKVEERGRGKGEGFTMNVPIPGRRLLNSRVGTGAKVIDAFQNKLTAAMKEFQPELVLISCGFDGHKDDPLGGFDLTDEDFATLTRCVNQIAKEYGKGRVVSVLEGGYNLDAIASAAVSHVRALVEHEDLSH